MKGLGYSEKICFDIACSCSFLFYFRRTIVCKRLNFTNIKRKRSELCGASCKNGANDGSFEYLDACAFSRRRDNSAYFIRVSGNTHPLEGIVPTRLWSRRDGDDSERFLNSTTLTLVDIS